MAGSYPGACCDQRKRRTGESAHGSGRRRRSPMPFCASLRIVPNSIHGHEQTLLAAADPQSIAKTSAHPLWLVERWTAQFGVEIAARVSASDQEHPVTAIRLRDPSAEPALRAEGIELAPGALLVNARRVSAGDVTKTKPYADGRIAIQDEASQLVAALVGKGSRILDCCAAPGGKTWSIADRNPSATIVAVELHARRAELVRKRVSAGNVQVVTGDIRDLPAGDLFDRVLADVPCSGTGTIARNPEIKWRLRPEDLADLHARQTEIVRAAATHLAPGGRLLYSTCALEREEDESVVEEVLTADASLRLLDVKSELESLRARGELAADFSPDSVVRGLVPAHDSRNSTDRRILRGDVGEDGVRTCSPARSAKSNPLANFKINRSARVHSHPGKRRLRHDDAGRGRLGRRHQRDTGIVG